MLNKFLWDNNLHLAMTGIWMIKQKLLNFQVQCWKIKNKTKLKEEKEKVLEHNMMYLQEGQ